jgi:hypothetical protein
MAGMEVSKIQVADIQPFTDSIKEIDRSGNSASSEERGVPVDENDSVKQSKTNVATDTMNTKTAEFDPVDREFPE